MREAVDRLPDGLREHVLRVETEAVRLAGLHGIDAGRLRIAALGHDLARGGPEGGLLELARGVGLEPGEVERASPILVHGPVAARMLRRDYGLDDDEVLSAVAVHTTARCGMTALEKALFIADKVESHKLARKPALAEVRALANTDLDASLLRFLDLHLVEAAERGWLLHPNSVAARNELLLRRLQAPSAG